MTNDTLTHRPLIIGTRRSALALRQSEIIRDALRAHCPYLDVQFTIITTQGDTSQQTNSPLPLIGGKGLFTKELEDGLLSKEIDIAVHCLKDLPTINPEGLIVGAVPARESAADVFLATPGGSMSLESLPPQAIVGTSSLRRSSQILRIRPDLRIKHIRGNIDTRIRKLQNSGEFDAIIMAEAGLQRLQLMQRDYVVLSFAQMLPAPGQGALGIQCRAGDEELLKLLALINDVSTEQTTTAERSFLNELGAGCNTPVAAYGAISGTTNVLTLSTRCLSWDGSEFIELTGTSTPEDCERLGRSLAHKALEKGFFKLVSTELHP